MITYMPKGGMDGPPTAAARRRGWQRAKGKRTRGQSSKGKGQKSKVKRQMAEMESLNFAI
jgi:hypothetical protein